MGRHGADHDAVGLLGDAFEFGQRAEIDQIGRRRQPLLERRDQGHAAGQELAVLGLGQRRHCISHTGRPVIVEGVHRRVLPSYSAAWARPPAPCSARHTFSGVAGI